MAAWFDTISRNKARNYSPRAALFTLSYSVYLRLLNIDCSYNSHCIKKHNILNFTHHFELINPPEKTTRYKELSMNRPYLLIVLAFNASAMQPPQLQYDQELTNGLKSILNEHRGNRELSAHLIKKLIKDGADPNTVSDKQINKGCTALLLATEYKETDLALFLLQHNADPNLNGPHNRNPLCYASQNDLYDVAEQLIKNGAHIDAICQSFTPLMEAATSNRPLLVQLLLDNGAREDIKNDKGNTALDLARLFGNRDIIRLLQPQKLK